MQVWNACKPNTDDQEQPNYEMDLLAGHDDDVNYVQFRLVYLYLQVILITFSLWSMLFSLQYSGCTVTSRLSMSDGQKEDNIPKFKNTWSDPYLYSSSLFILPITVSVCLFTIHFVNFF